MVPSVIHIERPFPAEVCRLGYWDFRKERLTLFVAHLRMHGIYMSRFLNSFAFREIHISI
jgi:hypothetical protein